ncbi:MAG: FMN-binding protein [Ardenticatenales bacterium]
MSNHPAEPNQSVNRSVNRSVVRTARRYFVSAFVTLTFSAYVVHVRLANPEAVASVNWPAQDAVRPTIAEAPRQPSIGAPPTRLEPTQEPTPESTTEPSPEPSLAPPLGQYRDGSYSGQIVDAYYGNVQVDAVVQQGRIANVQIPEFPSDRRTSVRINRRALPYLTSEVLQAQSANVDIVSGATLTSEAFIESLQSALRTARD